VSALEELLDWLLPTNCVLCGATGAIICQRCERSFDINPRIVKRFGLIGFAITDYHRACSLLLHAYKEEHQTALVQFLAKPIASKILEQQKQLAGNVILVPAPSSTVSMQHRGFEPALYLAKEVARQVNRNHKSVKVLKVLKLDRQIQDQAGLGVEARKANLLGAMVARPARSESPVLILDDVVTTGVTLVEANRALIAAGWRVAGFCAFAETLSKRATGI
jgi:predicted amidophosphoribosyltransferase